MTTSKISNVHNNTSETHDVIITRLIKDAGELTNSEEDLDVFLKLRMNRKRINSMAEQFKDEDQYYKILDDDEFFLDLLSIEKILYNMQKELKNL